MKTLMAEELGLAGPPLSWHQVERALDPAGCLGASRSFLTGALTARAAASKSTNESGVTMDDEKRP